MSAKKYSISTVGDIQQITYEDGPRFYKRLAEPRSHWRPSVTTILSLFAPPGLVDWWLSVPKDVAKKRMIDAGNQGTAFHKSKEQIFKGEKTTFYNEMVEDMLNAMAYAEVHWKIKQIESEIMVLSDEHGYGGSYDGLYEIHEKDPALQYIGDYKTGHVSASKCSMQLGAYYGAIREKSGSEHSLVVFDVKKKGVELLFIEEAEKCYLNFMCAFEVWKLENREMLSKMGWHWLNKEGVKL